MTFSNVSSYNFETDTWNTQPALFKNRCYHTCTRLTDRSGDGKQYVVVAGGFSYDGSNWSKVDEVEVYNIADNAWFNGPVMPDMPFVSTMFKLDLHYYSFNPSNF